MFQGFSAEDFDAYLPEKWSSNMFTLKRRRVKDQLELIGRELAGVFAQADLNLVAHLSDDHPSLWNRKQVSCQWLFFSRDLSARRELEEIIDTEKTLAQTLEDPTPLYKQIFIGVSVDREVLQAGVRLHYDAWVDRRNLLTLLADGKGAEAFSELCGGLPEEFVMGLDGDELTGVRRLDSSRLAGFISRFVEGRAMFFGLRIPRDEAIALGPGSLETIKSTVASLIPVYRFMAWSPENDAVSMATIVAQKQHERELTHAELEQERLQRENQLKEEAERRHRDLESRMADLLEEQNWREQERAKRRAVAAAKRQEEEAARSALHASADAMAKLSVDTPAPSPGVKALVEEKQGPVRERPSRPVRSEPASRAKRPDTAALSAAKPAKVSEARMADIQVGDRVRVVGGFLKDREGIVASVDEKGDLKVSFGMLSSRVEKKDVVGLGPSQ